MATSTYVVPETIYTAPETTYVAPAKPRVTLGKTPGRFYAPELDALRFLAFLLVFGRHVASSLGFAKTHFAAQTAAQTATAPLAAAAATHATAHAFQPQEIAQALDFGVCLFFFLSAFLITRLLLIEREATGQVAVARFYLRRCLRIWPLYFFFLALVVALSRFFPGLQVSGSRVLAAAFFVGNWAAVLHGWNSMAIQPLWSVSVEEQFYVIWPAFARRGRQAIVAVSSVLVLLSIGTLIYFGHRPGSLVTSTWPNTFVQGIFLAAGALTACFSFPENRWLPSWKRILMLASGFLCWLIASAGCHIARTESPGTLALLTGYGLVLTGTMLIFNAVAGWNTRPLPKSLLYLGKISYGLYVFHVACLLVMEQVAATLLSHWSTRPVSPYLSVAFSSLLALLLTIACASLTYRFLERPFLKLKDRFSIVHSRPA